MLLLEQFENLTLHPKSAAKLKDLVLQLAVQGKLTENWRKHNPTTEPASELLKRIQAEKAQLVKAKKIKKEQPLEPLSNDELIYDLPPSWEWVRLGELGDWGAGATPSRGSSELYDGDINWFKSGELNNGIIDYVSEERITPLALKKTSLRLNKPGDILIAMYGATIGKTAILAVEGTTNQAVCACTCYSGVSNLYLHLLLKAYKNVFTQQGTGGAQPNISRVKIRTTPVPLPPFAEQEAIVARVEELMHKIEELEQQTKERIQLKKDLGTAALQQLTAASDEDLQQPWHFLKQHFRTLFDEEENVKKLRETILQLAVQGKLTSSWRKHNPNIEPASELLKRIQVEKVRLVKEKKIKKEKPLEPISEDEIPYELPEGWIWCRLQDVGSLDRGKSKHRPRNDIRLFNNGKYPLIQTGDVSASKNSGGLILTHKAEYNDFGLAQSQMWPKGTLCITIAANIAETGFLGYDACFPDSVVGFTEILKSSLVNYIKFFIDSSKDHLLEYAPSTAQKNINLGILNSMLFPLPPAAEQQAIVEQANRLLELCNALENMVQQSKNEAESLMQAVVAEALQVKEVAQYV